jgi:diguanylate cyclase (GGDEF)-like protein
MKIDLPIKRKLFFSHFLAVILVSGSIGSFFYLNAVESLINNLQDRLKYSAALISQAVDARRLEKIQTRSDTVQPEYQEYLDMLRTFRKTNPDIAYLYLMRRVGEKVVFVIDSDETSTQAMPGQEYKQRIQSLMEGFLWPSVDKEIYTDQWGSFMSGYAPIKNSEGRYLIGVDMRATEVKNKLRNLRISGIISLLVSVILAFLFSRFLSRHFTTPIQLLVSRCSSIAKGRLDERIEFRTGDEIDGLFAAVNDMSANLNTSQEKNRQAEEALRRSRDELEIRVIDRTKDLQELNEKLVQEIFERKRIEEKLAQAATTDSLTGLMNRGAMLDQLRYHVSRYSRNRISFVILLIDLDNFKDINDTHGHDVGDQVLKEVGEDLRRSTRSQDLVSRWGGEEFLILLPDTDLNGGRVLAEKVRKSAAEKGFSAGASALHLTVSIGVSEYREGLSLERCIKDADTALYQAKHQGRNRVVLFEENR